MTTHLQGYCDPKFQAVAELLQANLELGLDVGASVAVTLDGEMVVDLWGGWTDREQTQAWRENTLINVWSCTKTVTALAAFVLVARGELDVFQPVAHYWPEFAANGKARIEIRHLLSHTSGVAGWEVPIQLADLYDWDGSTAKLAAQAPWWQAGTASGYHSKNYGHLIGEVIRRITGLRLGAFVAREITTPLAVDFHIGLPDAALGQVADVIPPLPIASDLYAPEPDITSISYRALNGPAWKPEDSWTRAWKNADIGAANGHGNARSLARIQSVVACGGEVMGVKLLSPAICDLMMQAQSNGVDLVLGYPLRFGMGYALKNETFPDFPDGRVGFWGGWGGSLILVDLDRRLTLSYVMNLMDSDPQGGNRGPAFVRAVYQALDS